jgi:hypothetical protein
MTRTNMRQHRGGPFLHRATGGAMEAPPCITFSRWRKLTPALFQDTRHGPAIKVWDETEFLNLPGPAEGRHHCRWRQAPGQPPSTTLKSRHAGRPKVAAVCYPLRGRARAHRAKRAPAGSHQLRRLRHYRAAARREHSRPLGRRKSTTPGPPSFPPLSASGCWRRHQGACRSPLREVAGESGWLGWKVLKVWLISISPQSRPPG